MPLALRVYVELLRYELTIRIGGFKALHKAVQRIPVSPCAPPPDIIPRLGEAVALATCFYWKPMLCLPRAAIITRLLRRNGLAADLVIGYCAAPFFSHAWVEIGNKIVYDSESFQERLIVLDRIAAAEAGAAPQLQATQR